MDPIARLNAALTGRYAIQRELGAGGMATVFLAHDLKHSRDVALKVLRPELAESLGRDRFLREIQLAAKLSHPHILPLYDSGDAGGALFYAMPAGSAFATARRCRYRSLGSPFHAFGYRAVGSAATRPIPIQDPIAWRPL